jgi:hypothetical protein
LNAVSRALHLALQEEADGACHLLMDGQLRAPEPEHALNVAFNVLAQSNPNHPYRSWIKLPITAQHCPWLEHLPTHESAGQHALNLSVEDALTELTPDNLRQGMGRRVGGWLASYARSTSVAEHLAQIMVHTVDTQEGLHDGQSQRMLLRLHDSAVLWLLWPMLTPEQRRSLLGPLRAWFILDPTGQLVRLGLTPVADSEHEKIWETQVLKAQGRSFELTQAQWADVANITAFNAALSDWLQEQEQGVSAVQLQTAAHTGLQALRRARAHGLEQKADLALFAKHALAHHPYFDLHPQVQAVLRRCQPGQNHSPERYSAASECLSASKWARISQADLGPDIKPSFN